MADFAKSIFGFGYKKEKGSINSSPTPPISASSDYQMNESPKTSPILSHQQIDYKEDPTNKFLPKRLVATPTVSVADNSLAYGTTSQTNNNLEAFLNQTFKTNEYKQQGYYNSNAYQQPQFEQRQTTFEETSFVPYPEYPTQNYPTRQDPVIITTDETGQNINAQISNSQPKGKLRVKILETRDIDAQQPYVVCTFESSEFVTNAPSSLSSYGKSPATFNRQNKHINNSQTQHNQHNIPHFSHHHHHNVPINGNLGTNPKALPVKDRPGMYQRQSSTQQLQLGATAPSIHDAIFDVVGSKSELDISVYDAGKDDSFLGHVRIFPSTITNKKSNSEWLQLKARIIGERVSSGSIKISWEYSSVDERRAYGPDDFEVLRLLGKGTFGQVFQVKKRDTERIYAMKVLSKKVIVKKKEIAHTIGERNILVRTSAAGSPFIVGLKFSFQTPTDLYLVTDYMSGGELFWHLQKEGRFTEERAKFYIAELVLALEHLHDNDIVYRDLKPENILLDANGHISLCDFGLSKANLNNDGTTNTFCGTTEYLAPEVLLDETGYTKMVDFWSLGVLIFEMCCGWSPFYAENTQQMYKNIAFGKVRFPKEVLSSEGRSFVKGLLNRNPKHRLGATNDARELRAHGFFSDIDWDLLRSKSIPPPFKPHLSSETDTSNFDPQFTSESTSVLKKQMELASTPLSPGIQANFKGFTYVDDSAMEDHFGKSHRMNTFKNSSSFIPGNPNLPPDEDVIDDDLIEEDEMEIDDDHHMDDEEFVNGRFDL